MVSNLGSVKRVQFQVLSPRCYSVPTHWVGRSVPCAGEDCPMCIVRCPRSLFFVGLQVAGRASVYEVPASIERIIRFAWQQSGGASCAGIVCSAERGGSREEWIAGASRRQQLESAGIAEVQVAGAVAELYRLQRPCVGENFVEWFERVRVGQAELLESCVLPGFEENRARRIVPAASGR